MGRLLDLLRPGRVGVCCLVGSSSYVMNVEEAFDNWKKWVLEKGASPLRSERAVFMAGWKARETALMAEIKASGLIISNPTRPLCAHGNDPASCSVCEDIRTGNVNTEG